MIGGCFGQAANANGSSGSFRAGNASPTNERTTVESTMSVRKLAIVALQRVNMLRGSLANRRTPFVRAFVLTAGMFLMTQDCSLQAGGHGTGEYLPFRDPFAFDPDFRWFEPMYDADIEDIKPKKRASTGWFGAYDKMMLWQTRPENEPSRWLLDSGKGDRYDLGYMLDKDHGWAMTYMNHSVAAYHGFDRERMNRYNLDQLEGEPDPAGPPFGQPVPPYDGNNFGYNFRFVPIRNSENVGDFHSFELNKTWRLEPYHYGGMLEPLVGARYMRFDDVYQRMTYTDGRFIDPFLPITPTVIPLLPGELVLTEQSVASNDLVGGQVGFRYFKFVDRFRYSAELRMFTMGSFQSNRLQTSSELTLYDADAAGAPIAHYIVDQPNPPIYGKSTEFAFGYDIRSEVSYTLTRMIELRGGFQMIDIAQGIWRGRLIDPNARTDQQLLMAGFTFGVALNR
jgi:hypothetical protein